MNYTSKDIEIFEGLAGVRQAPSMYIGDTGVKGFHHLAWEVLDNSLDEHLNGHGQEIYFTLHQDRSCSIRDFGRGIPIETHPKTQKSVIETVLTILHAGGKMGGEGYDKSGGLHGVGVSVTNALSEWLEINVHRDGKRAEQTYRQGNKVEEKVTKDLFGKQGTYIRFKPDPAIFGEQDWDQERIIERLTCIFYLNTCTFHFKDEKTGFKKSWKSIGGQGISFGTNALCDYRGILVDPLVFQNDEFAIGIQVTSSKTEHPIKSFVNNIPTPLGGSHEAGVKSALSRFLNQVSPKKEKENYKIQQVLDYSFIFFSVRTTGVKFTSQHKEAISENKKLEGKITSWLYQELMEWYKNDPKEAMEYVKTLEKKIYSEKEEKVQEIKVPKFKFANPKLKPCTEYNPDKNELFLVEGDSAGGQAKKGRNPKFQAVLSLRGKVINCIKNSPTKIFENEEIKSIVSALGGIGEDYKVTDCPYKAIIIMTDADDDGAHISTLLMAFFYAYYLELILAGKLYLACPPLFSVEYRKQRHYFFTTQEMQSFTEGKSDVVVKRFKGLGEMDEKDLGMTTMHPDNRMLIQITIDDVKKAEETILGLMGKEVGERKKLVEILFQ